MARRFEELDWRQTPMGELVLRRRWDLTVQAEVYEIKLDDEYLMSSLFTVAEAEIGHRALAALPDAELDIAVGGLGLGYTAQAVLASKNVRSLLVIDALDVVIEWHQRGLIPAGAQLSADPRCTLQHGDFFALTRSTTGLDPTRPGRRFHGIVIDIDHSPRHLLDPSHADFYTPAGLRQLAQQLHPGGVVSIWSNDPPDEEFTAALRRAFIDVRADVVTFANPLQGREPPPPSTSRPAPARNSVRRGTVRLVAAGQCHVPGRPTEHRMNASDALAVHPGEAQDPPWTARQVVVTGSCDRLCSRRGTSFRFVGGRRVRD